MHVRQNYIHLKHCYYYVTWFYQKSAYSHFQNKGETSWRTRKCDKSRVKIHISVRSVHHSTITYPILKVEMTNESWREKLLSASPISPHKMNADNRLTFERTVDTYSCKCDEWEKTSNFHIDDTREMIFAVYKAASWQRWNKNGKMLTRWNA